MKKLKNKILLAGIHILPAVSDFEICDKIRPYLRQYRLRLKTGVICFPEETSPEQRAEVTRAECENLFQKGISFSDIVIIEDTHDGILLYLRSGYVFNLTHDGTFIKITNVYPI